MFNNLYPKDFMDQSTIHIIKVIINLILDKIDPL